MERYDPFELRHGELVALSCRKCENRDIGAVGKTCSASGCGHPMERDDVTEHVANMVADAVVTNMQAQRAKGDTPDPLLATREAIRKMLHGWRAPFEPQGGLPDVTIGMLRGYPSDEAPNHDCAFIEVDGERIVDGLESVHVKLAHGGITKIVVTIIPANVEVRRVDP